MSDRPPARLALILLLFAAVPLCVAQQPAAPEEQEPVKVYTEEVRLPVVAYDDRERFDPTLAADDVLVLEDGVPQRVRSVRRVPADVLLVFDMGGQVTATRAADATAEEVLELTGKVPRDVGAQYVVTYTPLRAFGRDGEGGSERRRADVRARRMGLQLFALRGVVHAPPRATQNER